jgi:hypothetical protein
MQTSLPATYLNDLPAQHAFHDALIFIARSTPAESIRSVLSLLELGQLELRPFLLVNAELDRQSLNTLKINFKAVPIVPLRLDPEATAELAKVSGAVPMDLGAPVSLEHAGSLARVVFEDHTIGLSTEQPPAKPPSPPVPRERADWVQLAEKGQEPLRLCERDEEAWRLAQGLMTLARRFEQAEVTAREYDFVRTPPASPEELAALEARLGCALPEELVSAALRLGQKFDVWWDLRFALPREPRVEVFPIGRSEARAIHIGYARADTYCSHEIWLLIEGRFAGHVGTVWRPYEPDGDDDYQVGAASWNTRLHTFFKQGIDLALRLTTPF